jgi:glycerate kinase
LDLFLSLCKVFSFFARAKSMTAAIDAAKASGKTPTSVEELKEMLASMGGMGPVCNDHSALALN